MPLIKRHTQKTIKYNIKEINNYFVKKILNKKFKVLEYSHSVIVIMVDRYKFSLWHHAKQYWDFGSYDNGVNFLMLKFTNDEKIILNPYFQLLWKEDIYSVKNTAIRKEQYLRLKEEFEPNP